MTWDDATRGNRPRPYAPLLENRRKPHRYQLKRGAAQVVRSGHPWIFRGQLSSAAAIFRDGQWLRLVDGHNQVVGTGVYQGDGVVAIRVLRRGETPPDAAWFGSRVGRALARRQRLRGATTGFRALDGENDELPGVVLDVYGGVGVLQTYAPCVEDLGRYAACLVRRELGLGGLVWKRPHGGPSRVLFGEVPEAVPFREGPLELWVDPREGQKSGTFLDLRGLRRWLLRQDLEGKRVLNLFSYTGSLALACRGASVVNLDQSTAALAFARERHGLEGIRADLLRDFSAVPEGPYDLILVDPPRMTSRMDQVPQALAAYRKLYRNASRLLAPGGTLVACCCTSRISPERFQATLAEVLPLKLRRELSPEPDHTPRFPESDYLKIHIYR
ncbi:MAG: class I SAM-dependent methyltransferase [Candidatus Eremiobacterota bacterium]